MNAVPPSEANLAPDLRTRSMRKSLPHGNGRSPASKYFHASAWKAPCHLARIVRDCRHGQIERSLFCHLVELFERTWRECICCIHEEGVGTFGTLETQIEAVGGALGIDMEAFEHRIALFCGSEHALRLVGGRSIDDEHLKAPLGLGGQAVKGTVQGGGSIMRPHDDGHRGVSVAIPCHFAFSCPFCRCQVGADMLPPSNLTHYQFLFPYP